jgi:hypothetical protein
VLPKHPDLYTDDELDAWVKHLVDDQVAEGPRLDYKQTISLDSRSDHRKAAKDISSFANEVGGCLIYGIPEKRLPKDRAIPQSPYGIDPIPELESRLENIYVDAIKPMLQEWRIRKIGLSQYPRKVVYLAWTPESWVGAHMVEAYGDRRYYRRGQLRAVEMAEHEVRARYERAAAARDRLADFLSSPEFNYIHQRLPEGFLSRYVASPVPLTTTRIDTQSDSFRTWLRSHRVPPGQWQPSAYGVRTELHKRGGVPGWDQYAEIYRNGVLVVWTPSLVRQDSDGSYALAYVEELSRLLEFLQLAKDLYGEIQHWGALRFLVDMVYKPEPSPTLLFPYRGGFRSDWHALMTHDGALRIAIEESAATLNSSPNKVLKQLAEEMFLAFGYWQATCFDDDLNLVLG